MPAAAKPRAVSLKRRLRPFEPHWILEGDSSRSLNLTRIHVMNTSHLILRAALLTGLGALPMKPTVAGAQTDNFDTYSSIANFTAGGWVLSELGTGLTRTTFPAVGTGKGLRIQANPVPGTAPAIAICYRTTQYTNFYLAADVVAWADTNQVIALLARGSSADDPSGASGYLVNYDVAELGDTPIRPRQGELQISVLSPSFHTMQLAVGELTLEPGRPYRFVFTGTGFHFKAQVYDWYDLTQPLLEIGADDADQTYTNGVCGFLSYSRNGLTGTTDVTFDNYEIGESDANPATPPALAHPVAGTPTIESRTPAQRFRNCYNPSGGISFVARTFSSTALNASATKLRLNRVDVSSELIISSDGPNLSASLAGSALNSNTVYEAQIEVQDTTGQKRSTNTFWFDTFSEAFLASAGVKIIEAEDYNYSNGVYQLDPIAVSGPDLDGIPVAGNGIGYFNLHGIEGVDYHESQATAESLWASEFRQDDAVGLSQGMYPEIEDANDPWGEHRYTDYVRNQYAANNMLEFVVHRTQPGEWLNYTRDFYPGKYNACLRVAAFGASEVKLDQVTSNPKLPGQTVVNLGKFPIPNQFTRYNYRYVPLVNSSGSPVVLNLSGTMTLRLTMAGTPGQDNNKLAINYVLFVPITVQLFSSSTPGGTYFVETGAIVDAVTRTITVPTSGAARYYRLSAPTALTISQMSVAGGVVTIRY